MVSITLQDILSDLSFETLPPNWTSFDIRYFSKKKRLWDFQEEALKNAIKVLWKYYEDFYDYEVGESLDINQIRKRKFFNWYLVNNLEEDINIKLNTIKYRELIGLLGEYYQYEIEEKRRYESFIFNYEHFINRMCFWMATGSGKTLIVIKLIEILNKLMELKEIPEYDILFLTYREDLINQFKDFVDEYNRSNDLEIKLRELREYPEVKRQQQLVGFNVFYYRSDLLNDEQHEKIVDFKNYDDDGKWFIFLDEAHKGDREDSKRQQIYSILSRNGFLFNSSATFTDHRDIITCAFEFNLASFIKSGYGKHIIILEQEIRAFRENEDYSDEEKQKIVLKSLILLTYLKKFYKKISKIRKDLYHNPLLLTLVNSINTVDADLKLFFRELEKIGKQEVEQEVFDNALNELWEELKKEPEFMFEDGRRMKIDEKIFKNITKDDILNYVYNSNTSGEIEILRRRTDKKELAFKLKTSDRPFALIKIGDISEWLKEELAGYEVQERFEDESYFENLNKEDSEINILMGSRAFYEGWDSNRPNVINYINIGGTDAKKFVLQSVGRGVRIEPVEDKRKRLIELYNANEIDDEIFNNIKEKVLAIETLFIFGTNRNALEEVIKQLEREKKWEYEADMPLFINEQTIKYKLLIPSYRKADAPLVKKNKLKNFEISEIDFNLVNNYLNYISDDRVLIINHDTTPEKVCILRENAKISDNFKFTDIKYKSVDILVDRIFNFFDVVEDEFDELRELGDEIRHFKNIKVFIKEVDEIKNKIENVKNYPYIKKELEEKYGKISSQKYTEMARNLKDEDFFEKDNKKIKIKYIANHYYIPLLLSEDDKVDYINHIIHTPSEVRFIDDLCNYLNSEENGFKELDWWLFSKIDESLDEVFIPYYNYNLNKISKFFPDFVFWMKKGKEYSIIFIDPKGTEHTSAYRKIDGYSRLFEEDGNVKVFRYNGFNIRIKLFLKPEDISATPDKYRKYWFENFDSIFA